MTTFEPGDRVRLSSAAEPQRRAAVGKTEGIVQASPYGHRPAVARRVTVLWDGGKLSRYNYPATSEIELVPIAEPTVIDYALRERMIELAVQISNYEDDPAEIVARARAFESYILGDTK